MKQELITPKENNKYVGNFSNKSKDARYWSSTELSEE